ncbi:hypothetical protein [Adhaeretor mobilis]|uniref:Uncharacterized protein n=1 Tax=Adhaeretor mobilis TaxID=1930276 RepID=A0A517MY85_9BACT|nr:hypothetical protein [Adhaeretor mobilis]QDS99834.1 hypothetical protein HG15A2_31650 [Adhaeretor mobilis]
MFRTLALTAVTATLAASSATAQVVSYHHHSTVAGDYLGGYAEAVHAEGLNVRNRAYAYRVLVAAEREREALRQERDTAYRYESELDRKEIARRAEINRERRRLKAEQLNEDAQYLLEDVQNRRHIWPEALREPQYAGHRLQIESILRDWDTGYPGDRRSLEIVVTELRDQLDATTTADHLSHRDAVSTLRQLEVLALRRDYVTAEQPAAGRVASRLPARLTDTHLASE